MSNNSSQSSMSTVPVIYCKNVVKIAHTSALSEKTTSSVASSSLNNSAVQSDEESEDSFDVVEIGTETLALDQPEEDLSVDVSTMEISSQLPPESPAVKPPLERQHQNILQLLSQYNKAISINGHCNVLFVIQSNWIHNFFHQHSLSTMASPSGAYSSKYQSEILPIDNTTLLSDAALDEFHRQKADKVYDPLRCSFELKSDLNINEDYHLVPLELWEALVGWYGTTGPALPRLLFKNNSDVAGKLNVKVECSLRKDGEFHNTIYCLNDVEYEKFLYPLHPASRQDVVELTHRLSGGDTSAKRLGLGASMSFDNIAGLAGGRASRSQTGTPDIGLDLQQYQNPLVRRHFASLADDVGHGSSSPGAMKRNPLSFNSHLASSLSVPQFERSTTFTPLSTINSDAGTPADESATPVSSSPVNTPSANPHQYCFVCHKAGANSRCSKCSSILYCGKECQAAHWPFHKGPCKSLKNVEFKQNIVNYNYVPAYAQEDSDEAPARSIVFTNNKNNKFQLPVTGWKGSTLTKSQFQEYQGAQKMTYSLYGRGGKVGLANLGNSCYMNSSLQCISHMMPITHYMLSQHFREEINYDNMDGTKGALIEAYYRLLSELWFESKASVVPKGFKQVLGRINPEYAGLQQQDAHEVIELLLDKLHEDLNRIQGKKPYTVKVDGDGSDDAEKSAETLRLHKLRDDSIVHDTVGSLMRSQLTCPDCKKVSVSFEFHNTIQLAIPRNTNRVYTVVFVPEYQLLKSGLLAKPMTFSITLDRVLNVRALSEQVRHLIPAEFLSAKRSLCLFESCVPLTSHLSRSLKDMQSLTTINEGAIVYAYLPTKEADKHVIVYQRIVTPKMSGYRTPSIVESASFAMQYIGPPIMISYQRSFHTARVRHMIWQSTLSLFKGSSDSAEVPPAMNLQFELAKAMKLRCIDSSGGALSQRSRPEPSAEELEASLVAQTDYVNAIINTDLHSASVPNTAGSPGKAGSRFVVHNSRVNMTDAQKDLWVKAFLKKGYGGSNVDSELGRELPFDKNVLMDDIFGPNGDVVFVAVDLIGQTFTDYNLDYFGPLTRSPALDSPKKSYGSDATFTLYDCLKEHTKEETLDAGNEWYCNVCKEHKKAKKVVSFSRDYLPSVLILTLKRFEFRSIEGGGMVGGTHREKINNYIDFPIDELDLGPYCREQPLPHSKSIGGTIYDLFAVCNHYGRMGFGHYTAVAREWNSTSQHHDKSTISKVYAGNSLSDVWYAYDDNTVQECTDLSEIQNQSAYILFYRRRAV